MFLVHIYLAVSKIHGVGVFESCHFGPGLVLNGDHARFLNHARNPNTDNST